MKRAVRVRAEAERQVRQAAVWYEEQRAGLGVEFVRAVHVLYERVSLFPQLHPVVYRGLRRAVLRRFSYGIYYRLEEQAIVVTAVLHGNTHPRRWNGRTERF